jgi:hypothetical protein
MVTKGIPERVVPNSDEQAVMCPRCGYDLRGAIATWRESCPLAGRCGECGLGLAWGDLLSEEAEQPAWCVEFAPLDRVPMAFATTLAISLVPLRFWGEIRMTYRVRPRRLVAYAVILVVTGYAILMAATALFVYSDWQRFGGRITSSMSVGEAMSRAMLLPFSSEPLGQVSIGSQTTPYISPRSILEYLWGAWDLLTYGSIIAILGPISLLGLVASRRRAGVRRGHVARTFVYSLGWIVVLWAIGLAIMLPYYTAWYGPVMALWLPRLDYVLMVAIPGFVLVWWYAAIRRYLQMDHSFAVAATVTVLALAGGLFIMSLIRPRFTDYAFELLGLV